MLRFFIILSVFVSGFLPQLLFAQQGGVPVKIEDIRLHLTVPEGYVKLDADLDSARTERGRQAIEAATDEKVDLSGLKTLVNCVNGMNTFYITIQPFSEETDGGYKEASRQATQIIYETFRQQIPNAKIDTVYSKKMIGGKEFHSFNIRVLVDDKQLFNSYMLSRFHNNSDLGIFYLTVNDEHLAIIEKMLLEAKFY